MFYFIVSDFTLKKSLPHHSREIKLFAMAIFLSLTSLYPPPKISFIRRVGKISILMMMTSWK